MRHTDRQKRTGLSFNVIGGMVVFLLVFGVILMGVGYYRLGHVLTNQYIEQYKAQVKATAETAVVMIRSIVDLDELEQDIPTGGSDTQEDDTQDAEPTADTAEIEIEFIYEPKRNETPKPDSSL